MILKGDSLPQVWTLSEQHNGQLKPIPYKLLARGECNVDSKRYI